MTNFEGRGLVGGWVAVLAMGLGACGGTVDLRGEAGGAGGKAEAGAISIGSSDAGGADDHGGTGGQPSSGGVPGPGGAAGGPTDPTLVTPGPIGDAAPRVKVDDGVTLDGNDLGQILAYDANPDGLGSAIYLTTLEAEGCAHRLTDPAVQAKQPVFSADGTRLAYAARASGEPYQIHLLDLETGEAERVTDLPFGATAPSFSADGARLAFLTGDSDSGANGGRAGEFDIVVLDLDAGTQRVVLSAGEQDCCVPSERAPTFFGNEELAFSPGTRLVGLDLSTFRLRDIMPTSGRIPTPRDPSMAPDGIRYAYSDYCTGSMSLYIGRVDGSSGDTCTGATSISYANQLVGADWGAFGKIAAQLEDGSYGLVSIDDKTLKVTELSTVPGAKNPAWGPADLELPLVCQEAQ